MKITYDKTVDAAYIYLTDSSKEPETREVDDDINLDFDASGKLVGVEVLDASKRLNLNYLLWSRLRMELLRRKSAGIPVETPVRRLKNWIEEVAEDYVVVCAERGGKPRKITRQEIEDGEIEKYIGRRRIIMALRELWAIHDLQEPND